MDILTLSKTSAALCTVAVGFVSLIRPRSAMDFTGLSAKDGRGISEIRAVLGGFFIALGAFPLLTGLEAAYRMLGAAYLVVAVVRAGSMVFDRSVTQSNVISALVEILFGVILVL